MGMFVSGESAATYSDVKNYSLRDFSTDVAVAFIEDGIYFHFIFHSNDRFLRESYDCIFSLKKNTFFLGEVGLGNKAICEKFLNDHIQELKQSYICNVGL